MNVEDCGGTGGHVFVVKMVKYVCFSGKVAWEPYCGGVDFVMLMVCDGCEPILPFHV